MLRQLEPTVPRSRAAGGAHPRPSSSFEVRTETYADFGGDYSETFEWQDAAVRDEDDLPGTSPVAASARWLARAERERRRTRVKGALSWLVAAATAAALIIAAAVWLGAVSWSSIADAAGHVI